MRSASAIAWADAAPLPDGRPPLRVALFSGNYNCIRDGANQALNRLVAHLEASGAAVVRVYSPTVARPAFAPAGTLVPVRSVAIPGRSEYRLALGLPAAVRRDLDAFAPDLVHLSAPDLLGRAAQRYAAERGLPAVASLHTRFETYFDYYGLRGIRRRVEQYLANFYRRCDLVLAPNPPLAGMLEAQGCRAVRLWSRGVDHERFSPTKRCRTWRRAYGFGPDDAVLLFFGRLVREKGIADFAAVVQRLRERFPGLRPVVVGDGPARAEFARQLPGAVFLGHLESEALARAVASADILLNPSTTEAFGNVNLEAMAAGLAVVSAEAPSTRMLIEPGRTGLLCPPGDIDAYAAAVAGLIESPDRRRRLGLHARATSSRYRWDQCLDAVAEAYREVVG